MRKVRTGLTLNGQRIGGISHGIRSFLSEFPEIVMPKSKFRQDIYTDLFKSYSRFVKLTEREVGSMTLKIETSSPTDSIEYGGVTDFYWQVIDPLNKKALISVTFDEFPDLVYMCTLTSGIEEVSRLNISRAYKYEIRLDIEWVERVVYNNLKIEFKTYPLDPQGCYYLTFNTQTIPTHIGYVLNDNPENVGSDGMSYDFDFYNLYQGLDVTRFDGFYTDLLSLTITSGSHLIGIATKPFEFITGATNIQLFTKNGPGYFSVREVL